MSEPINNEAPEDPEHVIEYDPREVYTNGFTYAVSWDHNEPTGMHGEKCRLWIYHTDEEQFLATALEWYTQEIPHATFLVHCGSIKAMDNFYNYCIDEKFSLPFMFRINGHAGLPPKPRRRREAHTE